MICPVCDKDVQPKGFASGLQEILAARIHLRKAHNVVRDTAEMAELRLVAEGTRSAGTIYVDVDRNERWLG